MYCKYCGNQIDNDSRFCLFCGGKINTSGQMLTTQVQNTIPAKEIRSQTRQSKYDLAYVRGYTTTFTGIILITVALISYYAIFIEQNAHAIDNVDKTVEVVPPISVQAVPGVSVEVVPLYSGQ